MPLKRLQFIVSVLDCRQFEITADGLLFNPDNAINVSISENRLFRMFGAENFCILTGHSKVKKHVRTMMLNKGFMMAGKQWVRVMRSPSQFRTAKAVYTCLDRDVVRKAVVHDADLGWLGEANIAKAESRIGGQSLASTIALVADFTFKVVPDVIKSMKLPIGKIIDDVLTTEMTDVDVNLTDGNGLVKYDTAQSWAMDLGLTYVPSLFQFRYGGMKGTLTVWDWAGAEDIIFTAGQVKYQCDLSQCHMEILQYQKPAHTPWARLHSQAVTQLTATADDLIAVAKQRLADVHEDVLKSPEKAMKFLGMLDTHVELDEDNNDGDEYMGSLISKLHLTLDANPNMIGDMWVQRKLRYLMAKKISEFRQGRIPVMGGYRWIVPDPHLILGQASVIGSNIFHNGYNGELAMFRTPLAHDSMPVKATAVPSKELTKTHPANNGFRQFTYLKDLVIFGETGYTVQMSGADFDGDAVLITNDEFVVKHMPKRNFVILNEPREAVKQRYDHFAVYRLDELTFDKNRVGLLTDWATSWRDIAHKRPDIADNCDMNVVQLAMLQNDEIDSAKTGYVPEIPDALKLTVMPHWMERHLRPNAMVTAFKSTSPIGQLYDYIIDYKESFLNKIDTIHSAQYKLRLFESVPFDVVDRIKPYIANLEREYRNEMRILLLKEDAGIDPELLEMAKESLFAKYQSLVMSIDEDPRHVAAIAYFVGYHTDKSHDNRCSFPWIACFPYLLEAIRSDETFRLVPLNSKPNLDGGGHTYKDGEAVCSCCKHQRKVKSADGTETYEWTKPIRASKPVSGYFHSIEIDGRFFLKVPQDKVEVKTESITEKLAQFRITGFKHHDVSVDTAIDLLKQGDFSVRVNGDHLNVIAFNGQSVGSVSNHDAYLSNLLMNRKLSLKSHGDTRFFSERYNRMMPAGIVTIEVVVSDAPLSPPPSKVNFMEVLAQKGMTADFDFSTDDAMGTLIIRKDDKEFRYLVHYTDRVQIDATVRNELLTMAEEWIQSTYILQEA